MSERLPVLCKQLTSDRRFPADPDWSPLNPQPPSRSITAKILPADCALWLKARSAIRQAELMTGYEELDGLSKRLLEWIAERVGQGEGGLYVSEIIRYSEFASPATLSKLLAGLKARGLISVVSDPNDRRCRLVDITDSSIQLLGGLSAQLQRSLRGLI